MFSKTVWSLVLFEYFNKCSITLKPNMGLESVSLVTIDGTKKFCFEFGKLKSSVTTPSILTSVLFAASSEMSAPLLINVSIG